MTRTNRQARSIKDLQDIVPALMARAPFPLASKQLIDRQRGAHGVPEQAKRFFGI